MDDQACIHAEQGTRAELVTVDGLFRPSKSTKNTDDLSLAEQLVLKAEECTPLQEVSSRNEWKCMNTLNRDTISRHVNYIIFMSFMSGTHDIHHSVHSEKSTVGTLWHR